MKRIDLGKAREAFLQSDLAKKRVYVDFEGVDLAKAVQQAKDENKDYVVVEGWASTTNLNSHGFRILTKAWEHPDSFKRYDLNNIVLFNHKRDYPVGQALSREVRENEGLWVGLKIRRNAIIPTGEKLGDLIDDGTLKTLSCGIDILEFEFVEMADGSLEILAVAVMLGEISVVTVPSDHGAVVAVATEMKRIIELSYVETTDEETIKEGVMLKVLAAELGLPETATESEVLAEVQKRKTSAATLEATNKKLAAEALVREAGDKVSDTMKPWALAYAEKDPEGFKAWTLSAPSAVPPTAPVVTQTQATTAARTATTATAPAAAGAPASATLTEEDQNVRKGFRYFKDDKTMEELAETTPDVALGWVFPNQHFVLTKQDERTLEKRRRADEICGITA